MKCWKYAHKLYESAKSSPINPSNTVLWPNIFRIDELCKFASVHSGIDIIYLFFIYFFFHFNTNQLILNQEKIFLNKKSFNEKGLAWIKSCELLLDVQHN